jgi:hypothetical protein
VKEDGTSNIILPNRSIFIDVHEPDFIVAAPPSIYRESNIVSEHNGPFSSNEERTLFAPQRDVGDLLVVMQGFYNSQSQGIMNTRTPTSQNWQGNGTAKLDGVKTVLGLYVRIATGDTEDNCVVGLNGNWEPQWAAMLSFPGVTYTPLLSNWPISFNAGEDVADPNFLREELFNTGWSDTLLFFQSAKMATGTDTGIPTGTDGNVIFVNGTNTGANSNDEALIGAWGIISQPTPSAEGIGDWTISGSGSGRVDAMAVRGKTDDSG